MDEEKIDLTMTSDDEAIDFIMSSEPEEEVKEEQEVKEESEKEEVKDESSETTEDETESKEKEVETREEETGEEDSKEDEKEDQEKPEDEDKDKKDEKEEEEQPEVNERFIEIAKKLELEGEYESEEDAVNAISSKLEEQSQYINESKRANQKLIDLFDSEPGLKGFIQDIASGEDPVVSFKVNLDDSVQIEESDERYEKWQERKKQRQDELDKQKKAQEEFEENQKVSRKNVEEFQKEYKISDDEMKTFIDDVTNLFSDVFSGKMPKDLLSLIKKGKSYDQDIKDAEKRGEVRAKNERAIDRKKKAKEESDGIPRLKDTAKKEAKKTPEDVAWMQDLLEGEKNKNII